MARNNGNLNHHEELRLDYLQKNIHYLNEKERKELIYLEYKRDLYSGMTPKRRSQPAPVRRPEPVYTPYEEESMDYGNQYEPGYRDSYSYEDDFDLPEYPREKRERRPKRPRKEKVPRPRKPLRWKLKRFFQLVLVLILAVLAGMGFMFVKGMNSVEQKAVPEVFNGQDSRDGVNILILGTDGRLGQTSDMTRTDSIMVLNVNNSSKTVKLVSFMRDILVDIDGYDYKLNLAYTLGEQNASQGAESVRQVLKSNFDIDIKYYAMIDFSTFATTIDTLFPEGVTINAQFSTVDGVPVSSVEVPDDLNIQPDGTVPNQTIEVGLQQMDGRTLLNYARFRKDDEGDYGRTRRQQEVLSAVMTQMKDPTKLFTGSEALGKVYAMTPTTVPLSFAFTNGPFAALDAAKGIERTTIPENGDWYDDYDVYDGLGLRIDFYKYQQRLAELGIR
ncbi:LCP family protein [Streptococcus oriscaviae]|uniref:Regulatory protein MsrR n=1 Tax=Streptococcus oriscaviae TaxID=2781599 RepID=A0ABX7YMI1_9STRE|nr:LCP family protein [Streptococcus oriscaviae]QUE54429.1 LCP family protein [Streptococcus oriscaviae]